LTFVGEKRQKQGSNWRGKTGVKSIIGRKCLEGGTGGPRKFQLGHKHRIKGSAIKWGGFLKPRRSWPRLRMTRKDWRGQNVSLRKTGHFSGSYNPDPISTKSGLCLAKILVTTAGVGKGKESSN